MDPSSAPSDPSGSQPMQGSASAPSPFMQVPSQVLGGMPPQFPQGSNPQMAAMAGFNPQMFSIAPSLNGTANALSGSAMANNMADLTATDSADANARMAAMAMNPMMMNPMMTMNPMMINPLASVAAQQNPSQNPFAQYWNAMLQTSGAQASSAAANSTSQISPMDPNLMNAYLAQMVTMMNMNPAMFNAFAATNPFYAQMMAMMNAQQGNAENPWMASARQRMVNGSSSQLLTSQTTGTLPQRKQTPSFPGQPPKRNSTLVPGAAVHSTIPGKQHQQPSKRPTLASTPASNSRPNSQPVQPYNIQRKSSLPPSNSSLTKGAASEQFRLHLLAEKRRGVRNSSLHVAVARSVGRIRGLEVSHEPLSRAVAPQKFYAARPVAEESVQAIATASSVGAGSSSAPTLASVASSQPRESDADSVGTEETEEHGHIGVIADALSMLSEQAMKQESDHLKRLRSDEDLSATGNTKRGRFDDLSPEKRSLKTNILDTDLDELRKSSSEPLEGTSGDPNK